MCPFSSSFTTWPHLSFRPKAAKASRDQHMEDKFGVAMIRFQHQRYKGYPPGDWHIPPWEKENHLQNAIFLDMLVSWRVSFRLQQVWSSPSIFVNVVYTTPNIQTPKPRFGGSWVFPPNIPWKQEQKQPVRRYDRMSKDHWITEVIQMCQDQGIVRCTPDQRTPYWVYKPYCF